MFSLVFQKKKNKRRLTAKTINRKNGLVCYLTQIQFMQITCFCSLLNSSDSAHNRVTLRGRHTGSTRRELLFGGKVHQHLLYKQCPDNSRGRRSDYPRSNTFGGQSVSVFSCFDLSTCSLETWLSTRILPKPRPSCTTQT